MNKAANATGDANAGASAVFGARPNMITARAGAAVIRATRRLADLRPRCLLASRGLSPPEFGVRLTLRWREMDSNFQFRAR